VAGAGGRTHTLEGRLRRAAREEGLGPLVGNFMDITDRSNLEEQAARNARLAAVGLTVAGLAPYIKNLIHGLNSASYIVEQGLESKDLDMVRQAWGMVTRSVERVSSVSDDLLYYADYRLEERQTFDLNHLLQDVKHLALERAGRGAAAILVRQNSACRQAVMDQKGLRRALLNLAVNALDAAAQREGAAGEGRVVLGCGRTEFGQVEITVEDNGPGIPEEVGRYLFTGLFTTKGAQGTGMGLLLCQKIVEEHGGFVTYSCPLTGGTRFTILIPDHVSS
jgi:signal transduction histidine kinase